MSLKILQISSDILLSNPGREREVLSGTEGDIRRSSQYYLPHFYFSFSQFYEDLTHELLMEALESGEDEWSSPL